MTVAAIAASGPAIGALLPVTQLVKEREMVPGVGRVTTIDDVVINRHGQWLINLDTDYPAAPGDGVLLGGVGAGPGTVAYRELFSPISAPPGASIVSFRTLTLNDSGNSGWGLRLGGVGGLDQDTGVYFNTTLLLQESGLSTAPQFDANTRYLDFGETWINNANRIAVMANASGTGRAIVMIDNPGGLFTENVLVKEGDQVLAGRFVVDFALGPHDSDLSNSGDFLYFTRLSGGGADDGAMWLNDTLVAREGSPSPEVGRNYRILSNQRRTLNDSGGIAFGAVLSGSTTDDHVIIKNNTVFVREGQSLPDIGSWQLTNFGEAPIELDNHGNIVWFGHWNDPDTSKDTGLFYNEQLIVQEGVTVVNGIVLDEIGGEHGFVISPDGSWVLVRGVLVGGIDVAFLVAVPEPASAMLLAAGLALVVRRRR